jgi:hypothetical protein
MILVDGTFVRIANVRRARGRKPKIGETLNVTTDSGDTVKVNSVGPVRVRRGAR